jgi:hypothetical protein
MRQTVPSSASTGRGAKMAMKFSRMAGKKPFSAMDASSVIAKVASKVRAAKTDTMVR